MSIQRLKPYIDGRFAESATEKYMPVYDPSTGEVIAETPCCTRAEVESAVAAAKAAFPAWADTPCSKRVEVLYRFRDLLIAHLDELTHILCRENGKNWDEARGDLLKVKEPVEVAIGAPALMMGESLMNITSGFDSTLYREPLGVFAGIAPFNFPAMIPMGWMMPMCIATGKHARAQGGEHDAHDLARARVAPRRSGPAQGRGQHRHLFARGGGAAAHAPGRGGRDVRWLHLRRQTHLRDRRGERQARFLPL